MLCTLTELLELKGHEQPSDLHQSQRYKPYRLMDATGWLYLQQEQVQKPVYQAYEALVLG